MMANGRTSLVAGLNIKAALSLAAAVAIIWSAPAFGQQKAKASKLQPIPAAKKSRKGPIPAMKPSGGSHAAPTPLKAVDPNADQPILSIDELVHDFGVTWVGPKLNHTFKLTNKGTKPLNITKVRPSCGCTVKGQHPKVIAPGETGSFPFAIDSNKLRGKYQKAITVTSDDPINGEVRLQLKGECKRYVDIMPAAANFGRVYGGEASKRVLNVTNNTDKPLELELDVPADSPFQYKLVEVDPGQKYEIEVSVAGVKATGSIRSAAVLKTNVPSQKEIKVAATATVPKRLDVVPATLSLPQSANAGASAKKPTTRIVRFSNYGSSPAKVLSATIDDPKVTVTVAERKPGKNYDLRVEFPAAYQPPATGRTLTIKTDDKEFPELKVPIRGSRARQANAKKRPAELLVGKPAPKFDGMTTGEKPLSNATVKEAITVLDFFAVNCGYCSKQIPRMEKIRQDYEAKGVRFVAVAETMRNKKYTLEQVQEKIKTLGFRGELAYDPDNKIGPPFKATSFPTMMILGKNGKVAAANIGNLADLETRMKGQLDALIAGKPVPQFASKSANKPRQRPAEAMKGKAAPKFTLTTVGGKPVASADFGKHPATVLNFVAPNCGFCKRQLPNVEKIRAEYEAKGVRFVNMSQTMRKPFAPEDAVDVYKGTGARLEIAIDEGNKIGQQFKATSYPTMMVVGKDGKVAHVNIGAKADLEKLLRGQLDGLIKGKSGSPKKMMVAPAAKKKG